MTTRIDARIKFGCARVSEITNIRKALGQYEWQDSQISDQDMAEIAEYFRLVREKMVPSSEAILTIACDRTGVIDGGANQQINPDAINEPSDGAEERGEMVVALTAISQEVSIAVTDVAAQMAEGIVDTFLYSLNVNIAANLTERMKGIRGNFGGLAKQVRSASVDMSQANLPAQKKAIQPQQIGMWRD